MARQNVEIYTTKTYAGNLVAGEKIGLGFWDLDEGKVTISAVENRSAYNDTLKKPLEVMLRDADTMMFSIVAIGTWQILQWLTTGPFNENVGFVETAHDVSVVQD